MPDARAQSVEPAQELNCQTPSAIESVICADQELLVRHKMILSLYSAVGVDAFGLGPSQYATLQANWLKSRDDCGNTPRALICLLYSYFFQIKALASSALFVVPNVALPALRRIDPDTEPMYEALYRYATIADETERINAVEALIAPSFDVVSHQFQSSFLFKDIRTAHEAAATDGAFSTFIAVAALVERSVTVPCAALIRRPGLIAILDARYGSSIDALLPGSDCDAMLPPLPDVLQLASAAIRSSTACEGGSIRFAFRRQFQVTLTAARLHFPDAWKLYHQAGRSPSAEETQFRRDHQGWIRDAITELTDYYVVKFKLGTELAKTDAESAIDAVLADALPRCGPGP
jgi:hypothetical protein